MDVKKYYAINEQKSLEGVWIDLDEGAKICIAKSNTKAYNAELRKQQLKYRAFIRTGVLSDDKAMDILISTVARTVIKDWSDITEDGKKVPFSIEKAEEYLQIVDFREFIVSVSSDLSYYQEEEVKSAEGNSHTVSVGQSKPMQST